MLALTLAATLSLAAEPAAEPPDLQAETYASLIAVARDASDRGDRDLAERTARHVLQSADDADLRAEARLVLEDLPPPRVDWRPIATLAAWQAVAASSVVPLTVWELEEDMSGEATLASVILGGGVGIGSTLLYANRVELTTGRATAIMGAGHLGILHGGYFAQFGDDYGRHTPGAVLAGGLVGTAGGYALAHTDPDDGTMAAAYSGGFWGAGLGLAFMSAHYLWNGEPAHDIGPVVLAADLGVAGGYALGALTELEPAHVTMANLGGLFGGAATFLFAFSTQDTILWTDTSLSYAMVLGAVAGGTGGLLVVRHFGGTDRSGRSSGLALRPTLVPTEGGALLSLSLLRRTP